jgi:hypothetical protein
MPPTLLALIVYMAIFPALGQAPSSKYEVGTILAVTKHQNTPLDIDSTVIRYDLSIKLQNTLYVVLYTPPKSITAVEYAVGLDVLVSIGDNELTILTKFNGVTKAPILRTESLPAQPTVDPSKAAGQYLTMKLQNLTEKLNLTEEQQVKIKPIAEQERGEVGGFAFTPTIPRKERLERFQNIVRMSDAKMKPILSATQWQKLQVLRKEQKQELKNLIAQSK